MAPTEKMAVRLTGKIDGYEVESETERGVWYQVQLNAEGGQHSCSCPKGRAHRFCEHIKRVLDVRMEAQQADAGGIEQASEQLTSLFPSDKPQTAYKGGRARPIDKLGYEFGEVVSALQKEIRRGDEEAAVYWATLLYESNPFYLWRRLLIIAAEDVGFGDPAAVTLVNALAAGWKFAKEGSYGLSGHAPMMAVMAMCRAKKSTEVEDLQSLTLALIGRGVTREILPEYLDGHTKRGKARGVGWDRWYFDRHVTFGIPVNRYTEQLWQLEPSWRPKEENGDG